MRKFLPGFLTAFFENFKPNLRPAIEICKKQSSIMDNIHKTFNHKIDFHDPSNHENGFLGNYKQVFSIFKKSL